MNATVTHAPISVEDLLAQLEKPKQTGKRQWTACCPAHEDRHASLSISVGDDGRILLRCHAGCSLDALCEALDIPKASLFPERLSRSERYKPAPIYTNYRVTQEHTHVRMDFTNEAGQPDKKMWWQTRGQKGLNGRKVETLPFYPSNKLDQAKAQTARPTIVLCEGEKAASAGNTALTGSGRRDMLFVSTVTGAATIPCDDVLRDLIGFNVIIWEDNDTAGRAHMQRITERLSALGMPAPKKVVWPGAPPKGDAADFFSSFSESEMQEALQAVEVMIVSSPPEDAQQNNGASSVGEGIFVDEPGVLLSDVTPEKQRPLWQGYLYLRKIADWSGDPGLGKSLATEDIIARVTSGRPMPDGSPGLEGGAVLLSAEDDLADTIQPRLVAAGADLSRIVALETITEIDLETGEKRERGVTIPADIPYIERAIKRVGAKIVVIDPAMAFLGSKVDSHRDQDVRTVTTPLKQMAERMDAVVIMVRHLNKGSATNPLYRAGGSIAFIAAARTGMIFAKDPDDESKCVMAPTKSNLSPRMPALSYRVLATADEIPYIEWLGTSEHTAQVLLAQPTDPEARSATDEAEDWLRAELAEGPKPAKDVQRAARADVISDKALRRARERICAKPEKTDFSGGWMWKLREDAQGAQDAQRKDIGIFDGGGHLGHEMPAPPNRDCLRCRSRCWQWDGKRWAPGCDSSQEAS